ncbi:MAG TPA: cation diffusion facilitator family transporter [Burkholderiales bacterium]|nr:cation diffusion facilitator family transporter [Burkholderiales bacterium]
MRFDSARSFALLSVAAALVTIGLKALAWWLTGSVGLLSDALETLVNLAGAFMALAMLSIAARPPDERHSHGYGKAEYFASAFEGALIFVAAALIAYAAVARLLAPQPLAAVGAGLLASALASAVNFLAARALFAAGRRFHSIALEADAQHLMTDVWTSVGVIAGVAAVELTGWLRLDPLIALAVAAHILWTGVKLVRRSVHGLMDRSLPAHDLAAVERVLDRYRAQGIEFHALRSRQAGARRFLSVHVLVPGDWSVARGHELAHSVEQAIREALPGANILTHLEPIGHPVSYQDMDLDA